MINEENLKIVLDLLKTANILFEKTETFTYTSWKDKNSNSYAVILFSESDWIIFSSIIDLKKIKNDIEINTILLKLNLKFLGFKFAIDKKDRTLLLYQIPVNSLDMSKIKEIFANYYIILNELYY
jgi:hypothetical protein